MVNERGYYGNRFNDPNHLKHWKYVKRVKSKNGKWKYFYSDYYDNLKKGTHNAMVLTKGSDNESGNDYKAAKRMENKKKYEKEKVIDKRNEILDRADKFSQYGRDSFVRTAASAMANDMSYIYAKKDGEHFSAKEKTKRVIEKYESKPSKSISKSSDKGRKAVDKIISNKKKKKKG